MDYKQLPSKWQQRWAEQNAFKTDDNSDKPKFYNLEMFPYPSAYGLHMGHVRNYCIGDAIARFKRMQGYNVLYPMGFDAFGLPAENAAIKRGIHPKEYTQSAITSIKDSLKRIGLSYDWSKEVITCTPEYYRWNQYLFLKFYEKGLAYKKTAPINWCPGCNTVLANEQVENGKCWRCDSTVEIKDLEQWFLKITDYADELLEDVDKLNWPERIKAMQRNWIGKSTGTLIDFEIKDFDKTLPVFTTRPDTLFGATFIVLAPEHPLVHELSKGTKYDEDVHKLVNKVLLEEKFSRTAEDKEKEGMFIGKYAIHPFTGDELPIYIANFVLMDYGTGAIMAVPAHDERDHHFAKKYHLPITQVITGDDGELPYTGDGVLIDSDQFTGFANKDAMIKITEALEQKGIGKATTNYKLRDWLISRQRYWGTPIPIIYCDDCGAVPVPEDQLPVELPTDVTFTGKGNPLLTSKTFVNADCPACGKPGKRETDTMDTFFDSSWYFLRYCSPDYTDGPFDKAQVNHWLPVDQYIGGAEHAVLHLLYARFFTKVLRDLKHLTFDEPFANLFNQGMVLKDGHKMSKSKGNIVSQEDAEQQYGIDTARLFMLFVAGPDKDIEWSDQGVQGSYRFLQRLEQLYQNTGGNTDAVLDSKLNTLINTVTTELQNFEHHKAIIALMQFAEFLERREGTPTTVLETYTLLLAPFVPHVAEELWEQLGKKPFACTQDWPTADKSKINPALEYEDDLVQGTAEDVTDVLKLAKLEQANEITLIVAEDWKYELCTHVKKELGKTRNAGDILKSLMQTELKKHGQAITKLVPKFVNDPSKLPLHVLNQQKETDALERAKDYLAKRYNCTISVVKEHDSAETKAKQAMPGKPAIIVK